jgi:hypothetical protein
VGQKVNPKGFRVGVIKDWDARWYANNKDFRHFLYEDFQMRKHVKAKLYASGVSRVDIERAGGRVKINIFTAVQYFQLCKQRGFFQFCARCFCLECGKVQFCFVVIQNIGTARIQFALIGIGNTGRILQARGIFFSKGVVINQFNANPFCLHQQI